MKRILFTAVLMATVFQAQASIVVLGSKAAEALKSIDYAPFIESAQTNFDIVCEKAAVASTQMGDFFQTPVVTSNGQLIAVGVGFAYFVVLMGLAMKDHLDGRGSTIDHLYKYIEGLQGELGAYKQEEYQETGIWPNRYDRN